MHRINAPISKRTVIGVDGNEICYYMAGTGKGLWIIPPGLGTPLISWKYIFEQFKDQYTMVAWDARGTYESEVPDDPDKLGIVDHAHDLESIVTAEGFSKFVLGGWSMGVQISLEYYHHHPSRVIGLVLLNGTYEKILSTAFQIPAADAIFGGLLSFGRRLGRYVTPLTSFLLSRDTSIEILKKMHIVSDNLDFIGEMVGEFKNLDFEVYINMMLQTNQHSAADFLAGVTVPTLITAGTKDKMTPLSTAQIMHEGIAGSELFIVPNGTHYTIAEYPEIVNLRLEKFLRKLEPELFN